MFKVYLESVQRGEIPRFARNDAANKPAQIVIPSEARNLARIHKTLIIAGALRRSNNKSLKGKIVSKLLCRAV